MKISVECDDPNKSSAIFYWLLMKYHWTHAVFLTDFSRNHLLCLKTLATFPLSGDFRSHARQPRNKFHRCSFLNLKIHGTQNKFCRFSSFISQISFLWFLKFVYLLEYSIAWIPVWGDLHLNVGSFSRTPASNRASLENHLNESSKEV